MTLILFPLEVPLTPEEKTFPRGYRRALRSGIDPLEMLDAINECPHGRLPDYPGWACECWAHNRPAGALRVEPLRAA